jgi:sulfonate transport system permease protein
LLRQSSGIVAAQGTVMVDAHPALALKSVVRSGHPIEGRGPLPTSRGIRQNILSLRRFASPLALVVLWQAGSMAGLIPARTLAAPSTILLTAWGLLVSGELPYHLLVSLRRVAIGLGIGVSTGVLLAIIAGLSRRGEDIVDAPMQMLRTLPFLALVPLFILWFGIGEVPKVALVALGATFPVYLTLFAGIRGVDPKLAEAGRVFGLDSGGLVWNVILPGALPSGLVGLRYALGVAWLSLVVAEQINASAGIGYLINDARDFLRTDVIVVGLLVYALLGLLADALVRALERRALAWRPSLVRS